MVHILSRHALGKAVLSLKVLYLSISSTRCPAQEGPDSRRRTLQAYHDIMRFDPADSLASVLAAVKHMSLKRDPPMQERTCFVLGDASLERQALMYELVKGEVLPLDGVPRPDINPRNTLPQTSVARKPRASDRKCGRPSSGADSSPLPVDKISEPHASDPRIERSSERN